MFISSIIPESHRRLRVLRLFFPGSTESGLPVRWSALASEPEELTFKADWYELVESARYGGLLAEPVLPPGGMLDAGTAEVLSQVLKMAGSDKFGALFWEGYSEFLEGVAPHADPASSGCGLDLAYYRDKWDLIYYETTIAPDDLQAGRYPPSFIWDEYGELAWGSWIYPDSLFIAASDEIFRWIHQNPLVDAASVPRIDAEMPRAAAGE